MAGRNSRRSPPRDSRRRVRHCERRPESLDPRKAAAAAELVMRVHLESASLALALNRSFDELLPIARAVVLTRLPGLRTTLWTFQHGHLARTPPISTYIFTNNMAKDI